MKRPVGNPNPGKGAAPLNYDELLAMVSHMVGGNSQPAPRPIASNPLLGHAGMPIPKAPMAGPSPVGNAAPQIPRSGSVSNLLRRR